MATGQPVRALDRLKKAANLVPTKKVVTLGDGSEFEFWHTALTMAEREKAQKAAGSSDPNALAIQLLVAKALDENGNRMFAAGEVAELKNEVRDSDLQRIILTLVQDDLVDIDLGKSNRS
jgi:hypothetical protein